MKWFLFKWLAMVPFIVLIVWTGYNARNGIFGFAVGVSLPAYAYVWALISRMQTQNEIDKMIAEDNKRMSGYQSGQW